MIIKNGKKIIMVVLILCFTFSSSFSFAASITKPSIGINKTKKEINSLAEPVFTFSDIDISYGSDELIYETFATYTSKVVESWIDLRKDGEVIGTKVYPKDNYIDETSEKNKYVAIGHIYNRDSFLSIGEKYTLTAYYKFSDGKIAAAKPFTFTYVSNPKVKLIEANLNKNNDNISIKGKIISDGKGTIAKAFFQAIVNNNYYTIPLNIDKSGFDPQKDNTYTANTKDAGINLKPGDQCLISIIVSTYYVTSSGNRYTDGANEQKYVGVPAPPKAPTALPIVETFPQYSEMKIDSQTKRGSMMSGGYVNLEIEKPVTESGVLYSLKPNPTVGDDEKVTTNLPTEKWGTNIQKTKNEFLVEITDLEPNKTYHVRAYAKNANGLVYGEDRVYSTMSDLNVSTKSVDKITDSTAVFSANGLPSDETGFVYSKSENPTIKDGINVKSSKYAQYAADVNGLQSDSVYHVRAYGVIGGKYFYGNDVKFKTESIQNVTTEAVNNITNSTAVFYGSLDQYGAPADEVGFVYSETENPAIENANKVIGNLNWEYSAKVTGLKEAASYHVRAYGKIGSKYFYGKDVQFKTADRAVDTSASTTTTTNRPIDMTGNTIDTYEINNPNLQKVKDRFTHQISLTNMAVVGELQIMSEEADSAVFNAKVSNDGGTTVTERGIVYSNNSNFNVKNSIKVAAKDAGIGLYQVNVSGLEPETTYYVRPYAINSSGVSYGDSISFSTEKEKDKEVPDINEIGNKTKPDDKPQSQYDYSTVSSWALAEVKQAEQNKLVTDKVMRDFKKNITREEYCGIAVKLYEALSGKTAVISSNSPFNDTNDADTLKAFNLGIVKGTSANTFSPNNSITRQEICVMISRTIKAAKPELQLDSSGAGAFSDEKDIASWAMDSVRYANKCGIMKGIGNNKIGPLDNTTKEQGILLVNRTYELMH